MRSRYSDSLRAERSGVRNPGWGRDFLLTRPDRIWDPPDLLYSGYWSFFMGVERPQRGVNHSPISSAEAKMGRAIPLFRVSALMACCVATFTFIVVAKSALIHNGWGNNFRA